MNNNIPSLSEIIANQLLFLGRRNVQSQLTIIFLSLILAWLLLGYYQNGYGIA